MAERDYGYRLSRAARRAHRRAQRRQDNLPWSMKMQRASWDSPAEAKQRRMVSQAKGLSRDLTKALVLRGARKATLPGIGEVTLYPGVRQGNRRFATPNSPTVRARRLASGPHRPTGRNVGTFKGRSGSWVKGKGGRFVGSK